MAVKKSTSKRKPAKRKPATAAVPALKLIGVAAGVSSDALSPFDTGDPLREAALESLIGYMRQWPTETIVGMIGPCAEVAAKAKLNYFPTPEECGL